MKARFNALADWVGITLVMLAIASSVVASVGYLVTLVVRVLRSIVLGGV